MFNTARKMHEITSIDRLFQSKIKFINITYKQSFQDTFETEEEPFEYNEEIVRIVPTDPNVYIVYCLFKNLNDESEDGAIRCDASNNYIEKLLVSKSSFTACTSSGYGAGAVYFCNQDNGQCVIYGICSFWCASNGEGQFACLEAGQDAKNQVNDSSITQSGREDSTPPGCTLRLSNGKISLPSVNITNNTCEEFTALHCFSYNYEEETPSEATCFISYTSIVNNTAISRGCISFEDYSSSQCIYSCNIINNQQESDEPMFYTQGQLFINFSCILGNNEGKRLFRIENEERKIILTSCTIDDDIIDNERYEGSLTFESTIKNSFINRLTHITLNRCDSVLDSYDSLTPEPPKTEYCEVACTRKQRMIDPFQCVEYIFPISFVP